MRHYRIWESRTGKWQLTRLAAKGAGSDQQIGAYDTESDAFESVKKLEGGDEAKAAQSTAAQPWRGQCPACGQMTLRIRRYGGKVFHHCWATACGHDEEVP